MSKGVIQMKEKLYTIKSYTLFYIKNIAKLTAYTLAIVSLYLSSFIVNNEILKAVMGLSIIYLLIPGLVSAYYKYGYIEAACKYYRHKKIS